MSNFLTSNISRFSESRDPKVLSQFFESSLDSWKQIYSLHMIYVYYSSGPQYTDQMQEKDSKGWVEPYRFP